MDSWVSKEPILPLHNTENGTKNLYAGLFKIQLLLRLIVVTMTQLVYFSPALRSNSRVFFSSASQHSRFLARICWWQQKAADWTKTLPNVSFWLLRFHIWNFCHPWLEMKAIIEMFLAVPCQFEEFVPAKSSNTPGKQKCIFPKMNFDLMENMIISHCVWQVISSCLSCQYWRCVQRCWVSWWKIFWGAEIRDAPLKVTQACIGKDHPLQQHFHMGFKRRLICVQGNTLPAVSYRRRMLLKSI